MCEITGPAAPMGRKIIIMIISELLWMRSNHTQILYLNWIAYKCSSEILAENVNLILWVDYNI